MRGLLSDAFVFFGATGDLAEKKIFPALQTMVRHGHLDCPVIGVARSDWSLTQFQEHAKMLLEKRGAFDASAYQKLCRLLRYVSGDYREASTYGKLREALGEATRPLHYLAIPPSMFATVAAGLAESGCAKDARIIVEKPFGRSLSTAKELNATLHRFFPERAIFRIDHYLGKEPVQNLLYFRFANPHVDASWNHHYIDHVQITMAETFGVAGRGKFYEEVGTVRDVVQNHMLEVVACLAMERPLDKGHAAIQNERARLLKAIHPLSKKDVVRGQYQGYRNEPDVAPNSRTETFVAVRLHIANARWSGVPFFIRAGKCLAATATEVRVVLKRPSAPILDEPEAPLANYFRFRLNPNVILAFGTKVKKPGEVMVGERIELVASHQTPDAMDPYERLFRDALHGDATLFTREDAVEAAWSVVDPVVDHTIPLFTYAPGTWGPAETADLLQPTGGWYNPVVEPFEDSGR